jgi:hypothetical protein
MRRAEQSRRLAGAHLQFQLVPREQIEHAVPICATHHARAEEWGNGTQTTTTTRKP